MLILIIHSLISRRNSWIDLLMKNLSFTIGSFFYEELYSIKKKKKKKKKNMIALLESVKWKSSQATIKKKLLSTLSIILLLIFITNTITARFLLDYNIGYHNFYNIYNKLKLNKKFLLILILLCQKIFK